MKYEPKHAVKVSGSKKISRKLNKKIIAGISALIFIIVATFIFFYQFPGISNFLKSKIVSKYNLVFGKNIPSEKIVTEDENVNQNDKKEYDMEEINMESEEVGLDLPTEKNDDKENYKINNQDEKEEEKSAPTIELKIYEGPLYSEADDVCYYRVEAIVTGNPIPTVKFSKDDSLGSLGQNRAQVNLSRGDEPYTLTATATNSEGTATDSITISWGCNSEPKITKINFPTDTFYVGKQYEISVEATDMDGDSLSYKWSVSGGSIDNDTSNPIKWTTPDSPGNYNIKVVVDDGKGGTASSSKVIYVGEVVVTKTTKTENLPKKEEEGGYVEYGGLTSNGGNIYAGDSDNNKPCSGFISFDISALGGAIVESATLSFNLSTGYGNPLSFFDSLWINVLDWGARPIRQEDFNLNGIAIQNFTEPNISCSSDELKEELQKAINGGKSRFQIRIHFSGPFSDYDGSRDGWEYSQSNVKLSVTYIK